MFKNKIANYETYSKDIGGNYDLESSYTCYEVFIELSRDKDGNVAKNRDGSDRYHAVDDNQIVKLDADKKVKVIREGFYKDVYEVNCDLVEKVEREGANRAYYVVSEDKVTTLAELVVATNDTENDAIRSLAYDELHKCINQLTQKEKFVLESRFGINGNEECTLQELADELNMTKEGVRKIEVRAIQKLRKKAMGYKSKIIEIL